jgi:hypothetical protein
MQMDVFYATFRLTGQTRRIEVIDVGHLGVEYVEGFKDETSFAREAAPNLAIPQRRTVRRHARILDQCPRTKMANSDTAEQSLFGLERQSGRDDASSEQPKRELGVACRNGIETIAAGFVGGRSLLARVNEQVDRDARKRCTRLIEDAPADLAVRLCVGVEN